MANLTFHSFFKSSLEMPITELLLIEEGEVRSQYRLFLRLMSQETFKEESDMAILTKLLKRGENYDDVSLIIHILACAAIAKSVESIVESWGSEMEELASKKRAIGEVILHDQMMICLNGPTISHFDTIVGTALNSFKSSHKRAQDRIAEHFIRRSEDIESHTVSKVVHKIDSRAIKLPFML